MPILSRGIRSSVWRSTPEHDVLRIALTGGIGTGKSYVLARFHDLHVPTVDSDRLVHRALEAGSPALRDIVHADG